MNDMVVDSSVVAKWVLPEGDSAAAKRLLSEAAQSGSKLIVLDLVFPEVANAIWNRHRRHLATFEEARSFLDELMNCPVEVAPAVHLLASGFHIAVKYDRSIYHALFVALARERGCGGVTADEPLFNATRVDFPEIVLLRDY